MRIAFIIVMLIVVLAGISLLFMHKAKRSVFERIWEFRSEQTANRTEAFRLETAARIRSLVDAIAAYHRVHLINPLGHNEAVVSAIADTYRPVVGSVPGVLGGLDKRKMQILDAWGNPLCIRVDPTSIIVYSRGANTVDELGHGDDILYEN